MPTGEFEAGAGPDVGQELVFIGIKLDEAAIREALDSCLLTDDEFEAFQRSHDLRAAGILRFKVRLAMYEAALRVNATSPRTSSLRAHHPDRSRMLSGRLAIGCWRILVSGNLARWLP